jgi:hypothetical protein
MKWFLSILPLLTVVLLLCPVASSAQYTTYRVFFVDKGPDTFAPGTELYNQTLSLFNERALERRRKVRSNENLVTLEDAPVYQPYLDSVARRMPVLLRLRWANYAVVEGTPGDSTVIQRFPFVQKIQRTALSYRNCDVLVAAVRCAVNRR